MPAALLQLRELWADTFGDSEGYLDIFTETYGRRALILSEERSGRLISALWGLPFDFTGGLRGIYLCGLATRPRWRGQGVMSRMMEQAESWALRNGFDFSFLIPADDSLRRYYSGKGYIDGPCRRVWDLPSILPERADAECSVEDLVALESGLRERRGSAPRIIHRRDDWEAVVRESEISGGKIFSARICDSEGSGAVSAALFGERRAESGPMRIVRAIGDARASEGLLADLGAGEAVNEPYGMWKPLSRRGHETEAPDFFLLLD